MNQQCWRFRATNLDEPARLPIDFYITIDVGVSVIGKRQAQICSAGGFPVVDVFGQFDGSVNFPPTAVLGTPNNCFYAELASIFDNAGLGWTSINTFLIVAGAERGNTTPGVYYVSGTNGYGAWYNLASAVFIAAGPVATSTMPVTTGLTTSTVYTTYTVTLPCPSICAEDPVVTITDVLYTTVCDAGVPQPTDIPLATSTVYTTWTKTVCPNVDTCHVTTMSGVDHTTVYPEPTADGSCNGAACEPSTTNGFTNDSQRTAISGTMLAIMLGLFWLIF